MKKLILAMVMVACNVSATLIINVTQEGNDIVVLATGSVNTTELTFRGGTDISSNTQLSPNIAWISTAPKASVQMYRYLGLSGPKSMGSGQSSGSFRGTGDLVMIEGASEQLWLPYGYDSGTYLSGTTRYSSRSLETLGFNEGAYVYTWGSGANADSLTVNVIPEPSTLAFVGIFGGGLWVVRRFFPSV